jgi:hypothetical protein
MSRIIAGVALIVMIGVVGRPAARADVVVDWNNLATVTSDAAPSANAPASEAWSPQDEAEEIVAVAIFQAVNAINPRYSPFRAALTPITPGASTFAATAAAGHAALLQIFPDRKAALDNAYQLTLATGSARVMGSDHTDFDFPVHDER